MSNLPSTRDELRGMIRGELEAVLAAAVFRLETATGGAEVFINHGALTSEEARALDAGAGAPPDPRMAKSRLYAVEMAADGSVELTGFEDGSGATVDLSADQVRGLANLLIGHGR